MITCFEFVQKHGTNAIIYALSKPFVVRIRESDVNVLLPY